ncbi:MAG: flagellar type III secretion system pore protein FliP [bacterium]|nr:flagellar type III secretion system pore protein FliP [bacterium]
MKAITLSSKKTLKIVLVTLVLICSIGLFQKATVNATSTNKTTATDNANGKESKDDFNLNITSNAGSASLSSTLQILLVLTVISLAPSILIMVTSFTRIIIVLHFTRTALGTNTTPPNQIIVGLALFLTFFIMAPTFTKINTDALKPLQEGTINQEQAIEKGIEPLRSFMFEQTNRKDIKLFLNIADVDAESIENVEDIPTTTLIPAFIISELRTAFIIGFLIYIPFIIIDMVVASTLMSMGMMMLPPTTISMPFKLLLFILADGWNLIIGQVVQTFY